MDPAVKHLDYTCPLCGEKAVAGSHFCEGKAPKGPSTPRKKKVSTRVPPLVLVAGLALLVPLLWHWVGPASLLVAALGLLLWFLRKK